VSRHGAIHLGNGTTRFSIWAPAHDEVTLVIESVPERLIGLERVGDGFHQAEVADAGPGTRYRYRLASAPSGVDGALEERTETLADPASRHQPEGVFGPSEVVDIAQSSSDLALSESEPIGSTTAWRGVPLAAQVICELHVGTYTEGGTFDDLALELDHLVDAGYTAIELMPVAEFPGGRNWGYDGVFPFAVQSTYGGPHGLARLVQRAHAQGLAVIVDVVDNHIGPEGSVHDRFGPYFTDRYATPWGRALNFDGPGSDAVRSYFIEQACYFVGELGVDGLRLDAVHEIVDPTARPFLGELTDALHAIGESQGRTVTVVAETSANDPRISLPTRDHGLGCDGSWNDDFHHALRTAVTGEHDRWFADYGGIADLATSMRQGWVLTGRYSSNFGRRHGAPLPADFDGSRLVVFAQNHDQIGNAGYGQRLASLLPLEAQFPIAAAVLLSPFVPLRFMGEEYGETAPFSFFTSFIDPALVEAVRTGRAAEVGGHDPDPKDPGDPATWIGSRPNRSLADSGIHRRLLAWQRELLALRQEHLALGTLNPALTTVAFDAAGSALTLLRRAPIVTGESDVIVASRLAAAGDTSQGDPVEPGETVPAPLPEGFADGQWQVLASRNADSHLSAGSVTSLHKVSLAPYAVAVLRKERDLEGGA